MRPVQHPASCLRELLPTAVLLMVTSFASQNTGGPGGQEQPREGERGPSTPPQPRLPSPRPDPNTALFFFSLFFLFGFTFIRYNFILPHPRPQLPETLGGARPGAVLESLPFVYPTSSSLYYENSNYFSK